MGIGDWGLGVEGGFDGESAALEDVGVDHGGFYVFVSEKFLDGANIVSVLEEVGGEGVPKGRLRTGGRCGVKQACLFWQVWRRCGWLFGARWDPRGGA